VVSSAPKLSIIVPIFKVVDYLADCLDSVLAQSFQDYEVILVDDGSPDESGAIADAYAAKDSRFRVIHQPNGGLGNARNTGLAAARTDYVCFLDSDDLVTPAGYGILLESLLSSGSDYATGNVKRLVRGRVSDSPLHDEIFRETLLSTSLQWHHKLLWDSTAWNKVFNRAFFLREIGSWPEGVLYEDIFPISKAVSRATKIDVISDDVYLWRQRDDGTSITQDRLSLRNLEDRYLAVRQARDTISVNAPEMLSRFYEKILRIDLKLYLREYASAPEDYRKRVLELSQELVADIDGEVIQTAPLGWIGVYHLLKQKRFEDLDLFLKLPTNIDANYRLLSSGGRPFLALPLDAWGLRTTGAICDVQEKVRFVNTVYAARHNRRGLWIDGHAYIDGLEVLSPTDQAIQVFARERDVGTIVHLTVKPIYRAELAGRNDRRNYGWAAYQAFISYEDLAASTLKVPAIFDLSINLIHSGKTYQQRLPYNGRTLGKRAFRGWLLRSYGAPYRTSDHKLSIKLYQENLVLRRGMAVAAKIAKPLLQRLKTISGGAAGPGPAEPVVVVEAQPTPARDYNLVDVALNRDGLILRLSDQAGSDVQFVLEKEGSFERYVFAATTTGGVTELKLDLLRVERAPTVFAPLPVGRFGCYSIQDDAKVAVPCTLVSPPKPLQVGELKFEPSLSEGLLYVTTTATLPSFERGENNQKKLHQNVYYKRQQEPVADLILFESWHGKRIDDHPKAIHDELARRDDRRNRVFVIETATVPVPDGVKTVRKWSSEYWSLMGSAAAIVTNDAMIKNYTRRKNQIVLQTWHGTPLKKIGFDIENIHFNNKNYLNELAFEVMKWDGLISPAPDISEILKRCFGFNGRLLEIGSPRNDLLVSPGASEIAQQVRAKFGIPAGAKVALYAPTWRDDESSAAGKYGFSKALDLVRLVEQDESLYVLARGHHLMSHSFIRKSHPRLMEATFYPDIRELYLVSDLLITDYSSVMVDFSLLKRPIFCYAPDFEHYRDALRGFYIDFENEIPAPLLQTEDELAEALLEPEKYTAVYADRYTKWLDRYGPLEDGQAAARAATWLIEAIESKS
jgi:CDP-glycerol glycerophosphotransferase (TagB/SpsB family)/glycosyltransferase involved in cell wall biosynthesis